jgi:hypothetical protein
MAHAITFQTQRFDPSKETVNEINPIAGEALLDWLRQGLKSQGFVLSAPSAEDWGWYCDLVHGSAKYLIGASGEPEEGNPNIEWTIQIDKPRSMKDKLFGRNQFTDDDEVLLAVERLVKAQADFQDITVDRR